MTEFQLESGDTGQALLPVPVSAIAERVKQADASRSEVEKVKGRSADPHWARVDSITGLSGEQRMLVLAYVSGAAPEVFDNAMRRTAEIWGWS